MGSNADKRRKPTDRIPSLEVLINRIDRQVDQVPHAYATAGLGSRAEENKKQGRQYIRFILNSTVFAVPMQNAMEIDYVPEVTPLPNLPQWILGICNLRGDLVSVVDLRQIFDLKSGGADTAKKLILIQNEDISTAIIVDKIVGMLFADEQKTKIDTNTMANTPFSKFVRSTISLDRQTVHLLDVDVLMKAMAL